MNETSAAGDRSPAVWRMAGGTAGRAGLFVGELAGGMRGASALQVQGTVKGSVVFDSHGRGFVADFAPNVTAFSPEGQRLWETPMPGPVSASPAVAADGDRLVVGTLTGVVLGLATETGEVLWQRSLPTPNDPRILSDVLYEPRTNGVVVSSWGGRYWCLDARTGEARDSWAAGVYPQGSAAGDGAGNRFFLRAVWDQGVELVRVDPNGKEAVWHREPESPRGARRMVTLGAPVVDERSSRLVCVFNRDRDAVLQAFAVADGAELWRRSLVASVMAPLGLTSAGEVLVADVAGTLQAFDGAGNPRWRYATGADYLLAGPVSARDGGGACWIGDSSGRLHRVDTEGRGELRFEGARSCEARPSFSPDGRLYFPTTDGLVTILALT